MQYIAKLFILVLLVFSCNQTAKENQLASTDTLTNNDSSQSTEIIVDSAEATLLKFYKVYLQLNSSMPPNYEEIDPWVNMHCTDEFIKYLDTAELDSDPFINAQDISEAWVNNIKIIKNSKDLPLYTVVLSDPNNSNAISMIHLEVKLVDGTYKISNIIH